jgi:adenosine deaminase
MSIIANTDLIHGIPKCELHIHIEGTLEPDMAFSLAKRNGISLKYKSVDELKSAYNFNNLQDFLDIYYQNASTLVTELDFYDLAYAYFQKVASQNVLHAEIFFDPQTHTDRGISFATVINGLSKASADAQKNLGVSSKLIMCFLRHLDESSAVATLESAIPFKHLIYAVGLDSSELGHPPSKFAVVFQKAIDLGFKTVAHAGEEGPCQYVREAIDLLHVSRIDHGNHALDDESLVDEIVTKKIPLTVCPLSNLRLKVISDLSLHPLKKMLERGIIATINSDDPAYFGGYLEENYRAVASSLSLTNIDIVTLSKNSFVASFLSEEQKSLFLKNIDNFAEIYLANSETSDKSISLGR